MNFTENSPSQAAGTARLEISFCFYEKPEFLLALHDKIVLQLTNCPAAIFTVFHDFRLCKLLRCIGVAELGKIRLLAALKLISLAPLFRRLFLEVLTCFVFLMLTMLILMIKLLLGLLYSSFIDSFRLFLILFPQFL
jgi:hypothetical protein